MAYVHTPTFGIEFETRTVTKSLDVDWLNVLRIAAAMPLLLLISAFLIPFGMIYAAVGITNAYGDAA